MIELITNLKNECTHCDIPQALRYMGYCNKEPDIEMLETIKQCADTIEKAAVFKCCYTKTKIKNVSENTINLGFGDISSRNLYKHINKCENAVVFCATLGLDVDRVIKKYSITSPAKSIICDALASSLIEVWCDKINATLTENIKSKSRFSAGYGDFDIKWQKEILSFLEASKNVGVGITDFMMLTPTKSVTVIIGIGDGDYFQIKNKCSNCTNINCEYRNE